MLLAIIEEAQKENYKTELLKYDQSGAVKSFDDSSVSYVSMFTVTTDPDGALKAEAKPDEVLNGRKCNHCEKSVPLKGSRCSRCK